MTSLSNFQTFRSRALGAALLACLLASAPAQRGGGGGGRPGGGGPGGPGGGSAGGGFSGGGNPGNMGGPRGGGSFGDRSPDNGGSFRSNAAPRAGPQLAPPGRWWDDKRTAKSLNIRADQQRRMDDILSANKETLLSLYSNLRREEERLTSLSREDLQDEAKVFAGIDRVAQARADLEKANAHTLLQIRKELDAQQLSDLDKEIASGR